jgi:hypothetical protein
MCGKAVSHGLFLPQVRGGKGREGQGREGRMAIDAAPELWVRIRLPSHIHKRPLMAMQAFMDDSSDENGVYVLAGHIATEGLWAAFSKEWEGMLRLGTPRHSNDRSIKAGINVQGGKSVPPFNASFTLHPYSRLFLLHV